MENKKESSTDRTFYMTKLKFFSWLKIATMSVVVIYLLMWILTPSITHYFLSDYLKSEFDLTLSDDASIRYNPFLSHLTIKQLEIKKGQSVVFNIERLNAEIRLHRTAVSQLYVSELTMDGFFLSISKDDEKLVVAGVSIEKLLASDNTKKNNLENESGQVSDFEVVMPKLDFSKDRFDMVINGDKHSFEINELSLRNVLFSNAIQEAQLKLVAKVDGAPLALDADVSLIKFQGDIRSSLSLKQFDLARLKYQLPKEISQLEGTFDIELDNHFKISEQQLKIGSDSIVLRFNKFKTLVDNIAFYQDAQKLTLSGLAFSQGDVRELNLESFVLESNNFGMESSDLLISNGEQDLLIDNISVLIDEDNQMKSQYEKLTLVLKDVVGNQGHFKFNNSVFSLENTDFKLTKENDKLSFSTAAELTVEKLASYIKDESNLLGKVQKINVRDIQIDSDEMLAVGFSEFLISQGEFSNKTNQPELPELVAFDFIQIKDFFLKKNIMTLSNLKVDGLNANLHIGTEKGLKNLVPYELLIIEEALIENELDASRKNASKVAQSSDEDAKSQVPLIAIGKVEVVNTKKLVFTDESVSPVYHREFFIEELFIKDIDASSPNKESPFHLKGRSDRYTTFDFKGYFKPFTSELNLKLQGKLAEVSLPHTSSYIKNVLGFKFESGELDTKLDIVVKDSIISGNTDIAIRGLNLAATEEYDQTTLEQQTALPLNVALDMLKDGDGNVELDIPMTGNVNSPTFGYGSFIALVTKKAIQSAAQSYLIKTFVPYAEIVSVTISAGEFIMRTRFEDLNYQPGNIEFAEQQMVYVNQFIALMKDKKSTQVKVCAISTKKELDVIEVQPEGEDATRVFLNDIANRRMNFFKEFVVKEGIESSRILLCIPKVELNKEKPSRIEISV